MSSTNNADTKPPIATLADLPFHVAEQRGDDVALSGCRAGQWRDYRGRELLETVTAFSLGLQSLGVAPGNRVAILSESRPEWTLVDAGVLTAAAISVPIYPTLTPPQIKYILDDSGASIVIASNSAQAEKLSAIRNDLPALRHVVLMEDCAPDALTFDDVVGRGRKRLEADSTARTRHRETAGSVRPGDLATIIYTSGTSGVPKGVMLTHANILSNIRATQMVLPMSSDDVALSFLPLSHSFERMVVYKYLYNGVTVAFAESLETIGRDMQTIRPTVMTGVPRVYQKMRERILETLSGAPKARRRLARWALAVGHQRSRAMLSGHRVPPTTAFKYVVADRLVLSKIRARTGGRLRFLVSGSAPLPIKIGEFFHALGLSIVEGYGLTETSPVLTVNPPNAIRFGTVGRAIPGVELRIAEDGEILARGPNVMIGYHRKDAETLEALEGGWFHTGDVGHLDPDDYLVITDRKKDLIITAGGKKLAPQPIESTLRSHRLISEALVVGNGRRFPAALIVPNFTALRAHLGKDVEGVDGELLIRRPDVLALYETIVQQLTPDLAQFERIKRIRLLPSEFTIEQGELTPTLKVKRSVVEQRWQHLIDEIYRE